MSGRVGSLGVCTPILVPCMSPVFRRTQVGPHGCRWSGVKACEHQPRSQGDPKGRRGAVAHPRVHSLGAHPALGCDCQPILRLPPHRGVSRPCGQSKEGAAGSGITLPLRMAAPGLRVGCWELPGAPAASRVAQSAKPVSSTSCVYLAAKSPHGREEEEGGEPLPLPLRAQGALLRRQSWAPQLLSGWCPLHLLAVPWSMVLFAENRRGRRVSSLALPPMVGL